MKISVIGAGAMGGLFGGLLKKAGHTVLLIDKRLEHVQHINEYGLIIQSQDKQDTIKIEAATEIEKVHASDLIFIFVKSYSTKEVVEQLKYFISKKTCIVTLQNGIGNAEIIKEVLGVQKVISGTTSYGATLISPGKIYYTGKGMTYIGEIDFSCKKRAIKLADTLNAAGICCQYSPNIDKMIWSKVIINAGINAITAITGVKNGSIIEETELLAIMTAAVEEAAIVVKAKNIEFAYKNPLEMVINVIKTTANNISSMAQDVQNGRQTEIDFINGAIVREGKKLGIPTPVNEMLTNLIKYLEKKKL